MKNPAMTNKKKQQLSLALMGSPAKSNSITESSSSNLKKSQFPLLNPIRISHADLNGDNSDPTKALIQNDSKRFAHFFGNQLNQVDEYNCPSL